MVLCFASGSVLTGVVISTLLDARGALCRCLLFLCVALSSWVLCPENSSHLGLPGISPPLLQFRGSSRLCLAFSLHHGLETQSHKLGQSRAHPIYFPFLSHYCLSMLRVRRYENYCFIYIFSALGCSMWKICSLPWLKVEVSIFTFEWHKFGGIGSQMSPFLQVWPHYLCNKLILMQL